MKKNKASPKLRIERSSTGLKLTHRQHTGRLTPHRSTSYPVLAMILLVVGVLLGGMTHITSADSIYGSGTDNYVVMASVPGPAPTVAAAFSTPADGTHFTSSPMLVTGTCPVDTYISLYRNGLFSGVALCNVDGKWIIETSLFAGRNDLTAKVFNLTDVPGPVIGGITVYYDPPSVPINSPGDTVTGVTVPNQPNQPGKISPSGSTNPKNITPPSLVDSVANASTLTLTSNFFYKGYYVNQPATWQFAVNGGTAPYAISVDWGDGYRSLISQPNAGQFKLQHTYMKQGAYRGSYVSKVTATDAGNNETLLQLLAIINERPGSPSLGSTGGVAGSGSPGIMRYLLPSYGVIVLMAASFWLGEVRELRYLRPHHGARHRHA